MANRKRDPAREARWRDLVVRQHKSGLGVRAFCAREQVPEANFYAWRLELGRRDREGAARRPAFVPMVTASTTPSEAENLIVIELRGGRVLRVPLALPTPRITELVGAIEAAS